MTFICRETAFVFSNNNSKLHIELPFQLNTAECKIHVVIENEQMTLAEVE